MPGTQTIKFTVDRPSNPKITTAHISGWYAGSQRMEVGILLPNGNFTGTFTDLVRPLNVEMPAIPYGTTSTQSFLDDFTQTGGAPVNKARYYRIKIVQ